MSQQAGYSPSFKRPAEVLRLRRRTRSDAGVSCSSSPGQSDSPPACVRPFSPGPLFNSPQRRAGGTKRRNPFRNIENNFSPNKKKVLIYNKEGTAADRDQRETQQGTTNTETQQGTTNTETQQGTTNTETQQGTTNTETQQGTTNTETQQGTTNSETQQGTTNMSTKSFSERLTEEELQEHQQVYSTKCLTVSEDNSLSEEEEDHGVKRLLLKSPQPITPASIAPPVCTEYPADWSLKTRLLFTSPLTLSWTEHPRAQEEAVGLSQHCRAQFSPLPHSLQEPRSSSELRCAFQQSLVYWQHPSLPWISLFPRINAERSFSGKSAPWAQDRALQLSLMNEWSVSLSSLYGLLKARLCPYFYVCSYQFTVLFRVAGLGGSSSITALISPTTRGLREAMKAEGIEFSLPLVEERRRRSKEQQGEDEQCSGLKEDKDRQAADDEDDEDGSFSWLKEMGVQDKIKKPDSITMQLHKEGHTVSLDHKPESVVCVDGSHTFTLINFLINCKSLVAATGSQAGLPPTLLAPSAFRGATLHTLKARSVNVKSLVGSNFQSISSLEVTGPVLPSSLHAITSLLRPAQKGNFSAALYTHAPTAVMNTHTATDLSTRGPVDLSGSGISPGSIQQLQKSSSLGKSALTHINMKNYSFTWKN